MPAETHQHGRQTDADSVAELLAVLLELDGELTGPARAKSLADCGLAAEDLDWLWEAVCEELAERSLSYELDATHLDLSMTIGEAAAAMADVLGGGRDD